MRKKRSDAQFPSTKEQQAAWYQANRGRLREENRKWRASHKDAIRRIRNSPQELFYVYKRNAQKRGYEFQLSLEEFMQFWRKPCHYCGDEIETVGIDRIENGVGYKSGNVASCCKKCNYAKRSLSVSSFLLLCLKVSERHGRVLFAPDL